MHYQDKRIIVTGGAGFIGSNLAIRLVGQGARVTIIDPMVKGCGGNEANLAPIRGGVEWIQASIADTAKIQAALRDCDLIFNFAGEVSHIHSMQMPDRDLEINTLAQLQFLLAVRDHVPGVRVVYAGTRQVYGVPDYLPVDEKHPVHPVDFNGVHKYAATMYHVMLSKMGALDSVVLRFTNVYGPRMALDLPCQGFLGDFVRKGVIGCGLTVFGDGLQLRDPLYIDDALDAILNAGARRGLPSPTYNLGGPEALTVGDIAMKVSRVAGLPAPGLKPFPADRKGIDIGSYYSNSTRIREELGWRPEVRFDDGIALTLAYYRDHLPEYLDPVEPDPPCPLQARHDREAASGAASTISIR